jgi:intracellular septation protein A
MEYQKLIAAKDKNSVFEGVAGKPANADAVQSASVDKAFNNVFLWAGIICVAIIVAAGVTYVFSAGNSSLIAKAKNTLIYAIFGLVLIISSWAIVNFVIARV